MLWHWPGIWGLATAVAAKAAAAVLSHAPPGLSGAELKLRLIQSSLPQRQGETPKRTRSLSDPPSRWCYSHTKGCPTPGSHFRQGARPGASGKNLVGATCDLETAR